jgi:putative oxidoreductase
LLKNSSSILSIPGCAERLVHVKSNKRQDFYPLQTKGDTAMQSMTINTTTTKTVTGNRSRALNIALWVLQVLLAAAYVAHGWLMVSPPAELVAMMNEQLGVGLRIFIGVAELLAAAGLILPGITRILPWLTALAAAGLMIVMSSATVLHVFRGETESAISAAILFVLVTIVAYTRWKVQPIAARKSA